MDYKDSGVDIKEGYKAIAAYKEVAAHTLTDAVLSGIGGFSAAYAVGDNILVSGTDGVGTKLEVARAMGSWDTVGIDLVAMSVNDVICSGARPLFFLDYLATAKLDAVVARDIVAGVAKGCAIAGCALIGGETAEMPGMYKDGVYDIAGFAVGVCKRDELLPKPLVGGEVLVGLPSSGVHSNGFSLIRSLIKDFSAPFEGRTIGSRLLTPTRIYTEVLGCKIKAAAHITGGGFYENIPRMSSCVDYIIDSNSWQWPAIFKYIKSLGLTDDEMYNTFNCGIGMVLACDAPPHLPDERIIGRTVPGTGKLVIQ